MIKIDLEKKLSRVGLRVLDFETKYIEDILDREHQIITTNKNGNKIDRFSLNINVNMPTPPKYKLERIFLELYNQNNDLEQFINAIFNPITNIRESRERLKEILLINPDLLQNKIALIDAYPNPKPNHILKKIFDYTRDREYKKSLKGISPRFKEVDFRVCIYCNRNFISNFHTKKVKRATFTLDHFYQKDKYPIFALSLYNLVPSCAVCNTNIKGTRDVEQYMNPYSSGYNFENEVHFKLMPNYKVKLVTSNPLCYKYVKDFYHNEVYETHTLEVKEFVKKREVFTDDMITKLSRITKHSESRVKAFLFGNVLYKKNLDSESLGKLKIDLANELGII
ncbi:hypothetical protein YH65_04120 [Sulfurovum lithotrophicum]|uniref:HNH nuclease domain-containing protein n=1 Tax=Sulfurovum lithotrophicum TaxID=206403 RepID=A0A7U4RQB5_9BACT|nr:hypothetical protein [Sulfurovum lithotrophicum]AKF24660.1 hypothetical protein YH65_04120 [Sulfurovum lithotrophicum]